MLEREELNIADLRLDGENPRHEPASSQRDIIDALLNKEGVKMVRLAEDIAANGLSPVDVPLVLKEPGPKYTVLEGNRRTACIKLLANPEITSIPKYVGRFRAVKKKIAAPIANEILAAIVTSREEAKHWQELRHTGQRDGSGVVPWDTEASTRFYSRRGSHSQKALAVIDALEAAYPHETELQKDLADVRKNRLTTFGRLVSDPYVRDRLGIEVSPSVGAHYPSERLLPAVSKVLHDLTGGEVTVSRLKSKEQRRAYVLGLGSTLPDERTREADPSPLVPAGVPRQPVRKPEKPRGKAARVAGPKPLFDGVHLTNLGGRVSGILNELQGLDVDKYPNACAALLRVVIELSVTEVHARKSWSVTKLRDMVKKCVTSLDPSGKDPKFQAVRAGLQDGSSVFAVATIHAYMHNPHFNPSPTELRQTAANYSAFLLALDGLV